MLPDPCPLCAAYEGRWTNTPSGLRRCRCARGKELLRISSGEGRPPVMTKEEALIYAEKMSAVGSYYPADAGGRSSIAEEVRSMCRSSDEAAWLVRMMIRMYKQWPGTAEMRNVFCSRFQPLDGFPALGGSEYYPNGFPIEPRLVLPPSRPVLALSQGAESADPELDAALRRLADDKAVVQRRTSGKRRK